jgi:hypothetical protein
MTQIIFLVLCITLRIGPHRKHSSLFVVGIRLRGNAFIQLSHINGSTRHMSYHFFYYYYLLTAIGLMPGGSVYKGHTVNKEHSTPVSRKDDTYISFIVA